MIKSCYDQVDGWSKIVIPADDYFIATFPIRKRRDDNDRYVCGKQLRAWLSYRNDLHNSCQPLDETRLP